MSSAAPSDTSPVPTGPPAPGVAGADQVCHQLAAGTPVVPRDADRVQVGLVPPDAVVLTGPATPLSAFLGLLDGRHPLASAIARSGLAPDLAHHTIDTLRAAGLLAEQTPVRPRIRLVGLGLLGSLLAGHLHRHGASLWLADDEPADPDTHPHARAGATNAEAAAAEIEAADREDRPPAVPMATPATARRRHHDPRPTTWVVGHWAKPADLRADLTVVATDRPECDRLVPDGLMREDQPHLLVRGLGDGAVVGPLVHPGHGPCLRCCDLTRRDLDPEWPVVLDRLRRVPGRPSPAIAGWAAATAAAQVLAWLGGHRPETLGATLELRAYDWTTRLRRWPAHPQCGCGWR